MEGGGFGKTGKTVWAWWSVDTITPLTKNAGEAPFFQPLASREPAQNLELVIGYEEVRGSEAKKRLKAVSLSGAEHSPGQVRPN